MEAFERRLRSIYEAFDARNSKAALKLTAAALQKHKDNQLLRVLKGLALQRMDRTKEAFEVCDEVLNEAPTDDQVLNVLAMVYRSKEHLEKLTSAYEAAVKARPNDTNILTVLLGMYTRKLDFVKQQQMAVKLHRQGRNNGDYLWWIVTSLVLQARAGASGSNGGKLLQLAQSMASKQLDGATSGEGEPVSALLLYHSILQEREQYTDALKAVKGPMGEAFNLEGERELVEARLQVKVGDTKVAANLFREVAMRNPQKWDAIQGFLDCVTFCKGSASSSSPIRNGIPQVSAMSIDENGSSKERHSNGVSNSTDPEKFQEAEGFVRDLLKRFEGTSLAKARGPILAAVDVEARKLSLAERQTSEQTAGPSGRPRMDADTMGLAAAALRYFKRLGHLASCTVDLRSYSARVGGFSREWLAAAMHADYQNYGGSDGTPMKAADIQRSVNAFQVEHDLGLPEFQGVEDAEVHAVKLLSVYRQAAALEGGLDEKERGIADGLVALAAGALIAAWKLEPAPRLPNRLLKAVLVLEAAQVVRKVSAPLRLAAMGLYGLLGAPGMAVNNFNALDIKHIQHDTLSGQWLLPALLGALRSDLTMDLLGHWQRLYEDHARDAGDTVLAAFQAGNFTKVLEFVRFKERLEHSFSRSQAYAESAVLALSLLSTLPEGSVQQVQEAAAAAAADLRARLPRSVFTDGPDSAALQFNEDLSTRPAWLPPQAEQPRLAVATWWSSQPGQQSTPGYGRCWWARTLAAESTAPEAALHRAAAMASLRRRCLLPSKLAAALSQDHAAAAASLQGDTERVPSLLGMDLGADIETAALEESQASRLLKCCDMLQSATFAAASTVQASLSQPADEAAAKAAAERLAHVDSIVTMFSGSLSDDLRESSGSCAVANGPAVHVAAAFANEEAYWLALCLKAWTSPLTRKRKGKKAGADAGDSAAAVHEVLLQALRGSCRELSRSLQGLRDAVVKHSMDDRQLGTAVDGLLRDMEAGEAGRFWAWESRLDARAVLSRTLEEQNAIIAAIMMKVDRALAVMGNLGQL